MKSSTETRDCGGDVPTTLRSNALVSSVPLTGMRGVSALPRFSIGRFSGAIRKGFDSQNRLNEGRRKARDAATAHSTTPGLGPLAEPPIMDWDKIPSEEFSDARLNALFAGNPEKQCENKDLHGELLALAGYREWSAKDPTIVRGH